MGHNSHTSVFFSNCFLLPKERGGKLFSLHLTAVYFSCWRLRSSFFYGSTAARERVGQICFCKDPGGSHSRLECLCPAHCPQAPRHVHPHPPVISRTETPLRDSPTTWLPTANPPPQVDPGTADPECHGVHASCSGNPTLHTRGAISGCWFSLKFHLI